MSNLRLPYYELLPELLNGFRQLKVALEQSVPGWRVSNQFSPREKAALEWADSLTLVADSHAADESYLPPKEHFTDVKISDLTFAIALMNGMTRLAIGMRQ